MSHQFFPSIFLMPWHQSLWLNGPLKWLDLPCWLITLDLFPFLRVKFGPNGLIRCQNLAKKKMYARLY